MIRERQRRFRRETPIDCSQWVDFEILSSTYRDYTIRYREKVDESESKAVESPAEWNPEPE